MNARNLGVVFGRECFILLPTVRTSFPNVNNKATLMRSRDPGQEFADMAGKATTVEWLVNHAPTIFGEPLPSS